MNAQPDARLIDEQGQREYSFRAALAASPTPVVTYGLIAVNALVFLAMLSTATSFGTLTNPQMIRWGADFGPLTLNGQWWRMLTSCFLHFGFIHIGMNMFILYQAGVLTEKLFGNVRFLVLYLLAGLGGSVVSLYSHPMSVSAGASGRFLGCMAGCLVSCWCSGRGADADFDGNCEVGGIFLVYNWFTGFRAQERIFRRMAAGWFRG